MQHFYLLRLAVLLFIQFDFFLGLLLLIYCFLGLLLLVASDVVCFGQLEDSINEFVIIGFDLFDWLAPLAKSLIQFLQTTNFEQKAYLYAAGNLNLLQEGRSIIEAMEQKADSKIDSVERIVKSIKVH